MQVSRQPGQRLVEAVHRHVAQRGHAEQSGGPFARGPPVAVRAVGVPVVHLGVQHEQPQPVRGRVERHLLDLQGAVVQEERVPGGAAQRRQLVHHPGAGADEVVLGGQREPRQLVRAQTGADQRVDRQRDRALQGVRGRQAAAQRHPAVDQHVQAGHGVAGLAGAPTRRRRRTPTSRPAARAPASSRATSLSSPGSCTDRIRRVPSSRRAAATQLRASIANGRTKPSL